MIYLPSPRRSISCKQHDDSSFSPWSISVNISLVLQAGSRAWPWDYKNQLGRQYENFGNFHYGAVGIAAGIKPEILLRGAGIAQILAGTSSPDFENYQGPDPHGDDPTDQTWIRAGIDYAQRAGF